jgi:two-component system, NtrC family, response regulator AtoC
VEKQLTADLLLARLQPMAFKGQTFLYLVDTSRYGRQKGVAACLLVMVCQRHDWGWQKTMQARPENVQAQAGEAGTLVNVYWGVSAAMQTLRRIAQDTAATDIPVLLVGETGAGKEALARYIHDRSTVRKAPFVKLSCRFHLQEHQSHSSQASNGNSSLTDTAGPATLFLDLICELDLEMQRYLLHWLPEPSTLLAEEGRAVRMISASRRNLEGDLRSGRFLEELYFRLNGVCLRIPPLRERREDLPELIDFFFEKYVQQFQRPCARPDAGALTRMMNYSWPGNVRQLENTIKKYVVTGDMQAALADLVEVAKDEAQAAPQHIGISLKAAARAASRQAERELLSTALARTHWNRKRAAQELQISYKALLYKLKQLGLDDSEAS